MRLIIIFILLIAAVFLTGALFSFPLYSCLTPVSDVSYQQAVHFSILLAGLLPGIYYLSSSQQLSDMLGRGNALSANLKTLGTGFAAGLAILFSIELCLFLLGMRQADPDLGAGIARILGVVIKALVTGCIVSVTEETLFRGAIFTGLTRFGNNLTALILTSLLYGAVHFIDFPPLPAGTDITWLSGFAVLAGAFNQFTDPGILDSLSSLIMLGLLFGLLRWHSGNIILCSGLHAGIVFTNKIFSFATDFRPGGPFTFLVNNHDHQTGILASFWLLLFCLLYYFLVMKKNRAQTPVIQPDD